ncbi:helix-turn-helix domain-containing protein [Nonomuraea maritima]|uniref:helix-turn-helix domain-containing protein n=1 Tax=Nonomuraea maritima TaxID=683260 RepID=UPI00371BFEB8
MSSRISPPLRRAQLGEALRELRAARGLKLDEVAQKLGCSRGKVSNVENGHSLVTPGYVRDVLALYGADEPTQRRCIQLIMDARTEPWWKPYGKVLGDYVIYETEARVVRYWQTQVVPGLLQTLDYAREVIAADRPWEERGLVQLRARARIARQALLSADDPPAVEAIIGEQALRQPFGGPQVMADQLGRLLEEAGRSTTSIRVLAGPVVMPSFVLYGMPDMPTVLYQESVDEIVDQAAAEFELRFEHLAAAALTPEESADLIHAIREEFLQRADRGMA